MEEIMHVAAKRTFHHFHNYLSSILEHGLRLPEISEIVNFIKIEIKDYNDAIENHLERSVYDLNGLESFIIERLDSYRNAIETFNENTILNKLNHQNQTLFNVLISDYFQIEFWRQFYLVEIRKLRILSPSNEKLNSNQDRITKLSELITHYNGTKVVEGLHSNYKNIKGKRLKLLLLVLQDLKLLPFDRMAKKFHDCCKSELPWNIGTYNSMNGYKYNPNIDRIEFESMKEYFENLIKPNK